MGLTNAEFEGLIADTTKVIEGDIEWFEDEDHSPTVEFRVEIQSEAGYPIFLRASFNAASKGLTYAIVHRAAGRIYALDLGKDHRNPNGSFTGEKHKHRYTEEFRDKQAYVPADITEREPLKVWEQFCVEAKIVHRGTLHAPPPMQADLFI